MLPRSLVAPLAGAWIEIADQSGKYHLYCVAPLAGAWSEIFMFTISYVLPTSRSPRGSVD